MNKVELTEFHCSALLKFHGQRALTETALARFLKIEKAVARHAISVLFGSSLIRKMGHYEFTITPEGIQMLAEKNLIKEQGERKKPGPKPKPISEAVATMVQKETQALTAKIDATPASANIAEDIHQSAADTREPEPTHQVPDDSPEQAEAVNAQLTAEKPTELPESIQSATADFDTLVRQGLERLNKQLKYSPVAIEKKRQKVAMLTSLADTLDGFDRNISASLREVATDINKLPEVSHGLHN